MNKDSEDKTYRILAINPGGTSTKIGVFKNEITVLMKNVVHGEKELAGFSEPNDQREYRSAAVMKALTEAGVDIASFDAYTGRGGSMAACEGGTYFVNENKALRDGQASPTPNAQTTNFTRKCRQLSAL